jgi:hypothetical protein
VQTETDGRFQCLKRRIRRGRNQLRRARTGLHRPARKDQGGRMKAEG